MRRCIVGVVGGCGKSPSRLTLFEEVRDEALPVRRPAILKQKLFTRLPQRHVGPELRGGKRFSRQRIGGMSA